MTDMQLRQDIIDELDFDPSVDSAHIGVAAEKGVVTLSGHIASYAEKLAAGKAVRRVAGVRAIAEGIKVRFPSDKKTADDEIATRALSILRWSAVVPSDCVQVKVENGWVNWSGQVEWQFQRAVAETISAGSRAWRAWSMRLRSRRKFSRAMSNARSKPL